MPCRLLPFHPTARSSYFTFRSRTNHRIWFLFFDRFVWVSTAQEEMKMRTPAVSFAALLMLLLLATRAHGIRLDRQLHEAVNSKKMADPKAGDAEASVAGSDSVKKHCTPDGRCSGKVKKALAHAEAAAEAKQQASSNSTGNDHHSTTVNGVAAQQQGRHHEAASSSPASPSVARQRQTYPDIMDIAGMDYSPATRKPPIHN